MIPWKGNWLHWKTTRKRFRTLWTVKEILFRNEFLNLWNLLFLKKKERYSESLVNLYVYTFLQDQKTFIFFSYEITVNQCFCITDTCEFWNLIDGRNASLKNTEAKVFIYPQEYMLDDYRKNVHNITYTHFGDIFLKTFLIKKEKDSSQSSGTKKKTMPNI